MPHSVVCSHLEWDCDLVCRWAGCAETQGGRDRSAGTLRLRQGGGFANVTVKQVAEPELGPREGGRGRRRGEKEHKVGGHCRPHGDILLSKATRWKSVRQSSLRSDSILPPEKRLMGGALTTVFLPGVPPFTTNSPRVPLGRSLFLAADLRLAIAHRTDVPRREKGQWKGRENGGVGGEGGKRKRASELGPAIPTGALVPGLLAVGSSICFI